MNARRAHGPPPFPKRQIIPDQYSVHNQEKAVSRALL